MCAWLFHVLTGFCQGAKHKPARGRSRVLVANTAFTKIAGAAFRSQERNGRFHAFFSRRSSSLCYFCERCSFIQGLFSSGHGRRQSIYHRFLARLGLPRRNVAPVKASSMATTSAAVSSCL